MLDNVISRARIILKEAQQKLPAEAADDVKQVYSEIYNLKASLNKEVESTVNDEKLDGSAKRDAKRNIFEKTGRKLEVLKAKRDYSALGRKLEAKLIEASEKEDDSIFKFLREREIRDRLACMTEPQILSHFGESLFRGSNPPLLDAILNAPLGFEILQNDTLKKLRLVRAKMMNPEIAVELDTVRKLNSIIEKIFTLAKKELDDLRKKELPPSILRR
jgi:hypothetical protein